MVRKAILLVCSLIGVGACIDIVDAKIYDNPTLTVLENAEYDSTKMIMEQIEYLGGSVIFVFSLTYSSQIYRVV